MSDKNSILEVYRIIWCHPPEYLQLSRRVCYFPYIVKIVALGFTSFVLGSTSSTVSSMS